jgi:7-carboxy-7-deazaguanine synthase
VRATRLAMKYRINEIFKSLQGEGINTGREVAFIRFSGCNLSCPWCDTDHSEYYLLTADEMLTQVRKFNIDSVILTGGEPSIRNLGPVKKALKKAGLWIGIETNGTNDIKGFDYIAVSPKSLDGIKIKKANEVRVVYPGGFPAIDSKETLLKIEKLIQAEYYLLSPLYENGRFNFEPCIKLLGEINKCSTIRWILSIQTHKLIGIK